MYLVLKTRPIISLFFPMQVTKIKYNSNKIILSKILSNKYVSVSYALSEHLKTSSSKYCYKWVIYN